MKGAILFLFCLLLNTITFSQSKCDILTKGTFTYKNGDSKVKVIINDGNHTEYHNGGKYQIKSKIKRVSDCEFIMTVKDCSIPNFALSPGTKFKFVVTKVRGKKVLYTTYFRNNSWEGKLKKISDETSLEKEES